MSFEIKPAVRKQSPVSVYMEGESGSGKTYSALLLARGLCGPGSKIGIIDTEGGRSLIYADDPLIGGFEHLHFDSPYSPDRFIEAIGLAVDSGWGAIIIDSASLEHDGEGGLIEMAEAEAAKGRNAMQKWIKPKHDHKKFLNYAVGLPVHIIMCFRQTLTTDFSANPPTAIRTAVAEKNTKFSMEMHCTIDAEHRAHWSRVPKPYLHCIQQDQPISVNTGVELAQASGGTPQANDDGPTPIQIIEEFMGEHGFVDDDMNRELSVLFKKEITDWRKLTSKQIEQISASEKLEVIRKAINE